MELEHNQRLWVHYRADLRIRNTSPQTVRNYFETLQKADRHFKSSFLDLTRLDIKSYIAELLDQLAPSTVETHFVGLRVFFNFLVREELISKSPLAGLEPPEVPDNPPKIIAAGDLAKLLKACSGTDFRSRRDNALIRLMLEPGGPRRSEVIGMSVEGTDLTNEIIRIIGKGNKTRFMTYGAKTGLALLRYSSLRERHKHASSEKFWLGRRGALTIWALSQIIETRCEQAGIERLHPHLFRHTAADRSMAAGISDTDMMTLFGWSTQRMLGVYARSNRTSRALETAKRLAIGDRL